MEILRRAREKSFGIHYNVLRATARRDVIAISCLSVIENLQSFRTHQGPVTRTRAGRKARDIVTRNERIVAFSSPLLLKDRQRARAVGKGGKKRTEESI